MKAAGGKTVLLIGSGGREHAMAWKLASSRLVSRLIVVPGNDGMSPDWERWAMPLQGRADFEAIAHKARDAGVDLAVIGPDNPLADGIVDVFEEAGLLSFGPRAAAAKIEASKAFAKEVMQAGGVPTAKYHLARSVDEARAILEKLDWSLGGWVIKADGLALGKGVQVCPTLEEAREALLSIKSLGSAADQILIEERLQGEELSWFAFCDGETCSLMEPARDYKRAYDGNRGPNTGGMGAFSPVPGVTDALFEKVRREVFLPTLTELKRRGAPFRGVLYAGLMVDLARDRVWVIEFNCRFGDPETQVVLARMSDDLIEWCEASARGSIASRPARVGFSKQAAVVVIGAAKGYPENPVKGAVIEGPLASDGPPSYVCAGVARRADGKLVTNGGRVFGAIGVGESLESARAQAYERLARVKFEGIHFRSDVAAGLVR